MPDPIVDAINSLRADVDSLLERELPRYATGTWTPAWTGTSTAGVYTYTTQSGYYVQVGKVVFFWGRMVITAIGTPPVGNMTITGLPLTVSNDFNFGGSLAWGRINSFNYTAAALALVGRTVPNATRIDLGEVFDNGSEVAPPAGNFTNTACDVVFSGAYLAA